MLLLSQYFIFWAPTMLDKYVYPGTHVLANRFGIREATTLTMLEQDLTVDLIDELYMDRHPLLFGSLPNEKLLKSLHKHLFKDIYTWAGEYRDCLVAKAEPLLNNRSVPYPPPSSMIDGERLMSDALKDAFAQLPGIKSARKEPNQYIDKLAKFVTDLWVAHPFREGNTRTITLFMQALTSNHGLNMTQNLTDRVNGVRFRDMLVKASAGDMVDLKKSLDRCLMWPALDQQEEENSGMYSS